ncbi:MAG: diaminopimelate epimerase [Phocaeicola plebeius]|nr:diaminopimelate epimerase [Phocaeicola plebeius]
MKIRFTKMHGLGNDYIYVNTSLYPIAHPEQVSVEWSRYHTGIGSDGLVLIGASDKADFSMRIFNADGSEAKMCGNASRCIGKYLYEYGLTDRTDITLDTLSGIKLLHLEVKDGEVESVTVDMGIPSDIRPVDLGSGYGYTEGIAVSMGNPHLVLFVEDISQVDLPKVGPLLERHPLFPDRVNVEFAQVLDDGHIRMRVWERGSGITQACGTGACATAVAAAFTHRCRPQSAVCMDGGTLHIRWMGMGNRLFMTGPATKVFDGEIELETKNND